VQASYEVATLKMKRKQSLCAATTFTMDFLLCTPLLLSRDAPIPILDLELVGIGWNWNWNWLGLTWNWNWN
jgi:hypothetical protein